MSFQLSRNGYGALDSYNGPYPLDQLQRARDTLIHGFNTYNSYTFDRLNRIIYLENSSHEANWEYSEDNYTESEAEAEPVIRPISDPTVQEKPTAQYDDPCLKQEIQSGSKGEPSRSEEQFVCPSEANNTLFYSPAGFKNRFAQELLKKQTPKTIIFNKIDLKVKRKSQPNDEGISNVSNGESVSKKAKIDVIDLVDKEKRLLEGFKCDYCDFTSLKSEETLSHLNEAQHSYASRCLGEIDNGKLSPFYIVEELCLQSDQKRFTKVATCPKCFTMFSNIYVCASHSKMCVNNFSHHQNGVYAISDVVQNTDALIPVDSICQVCKLKCAKHRVLNIHYEACNHYPFEQPKSSDILLSFLCRYCNKDFSNFFVAKSHVITHAAKQPRVLMVLQLIYYKMTTVTNKLLPKRYLPLMRSTRVKPERKTNKKKQRNFE